VGLTYIAKLEKSSSFSVLGEVEEGEDCVQKVGGSGNDAKTAQSETDLLFLGNALVLVLALVTTPVMQGGAAHGYEHESAHEVHQNVLENKTKINKEKKYDFDAFLLHIIIFINQYELE